MNALEDLFGDLNFELEVQEPVTQAELDAAPPAPPEPKPFSAPIPGSLPPARASHAPGAALGVASLRSSAPIPGSPPPARTSRAPSPFDPRYTELAVDALDRLAPAGTMLTENDPVAAIPTRPYDVPVEELFGDVHSSMLTVPVALGDLPDEAYPTDVTPTALW